MARRMAAATEKFLKLINRGYSRAYAMKHTGVSRATAYRLFPSSKGRGKAKT